MRLVLQGMDCVADDGLGFGADRQHGFATRTLIEALDALDAPVAASDAPAERAGSEVAAPPQTRPRDEHGALGRIGLGGTPSPAATQMYGVLASDPAVPRRAWLTAELMANGVFAALPPAHAEGSPARGGGLKLLQGLPGAAGWWMENLKRTPFSFSDSYVPRRDVTVYRRGGPPNQYEGGWFPTAAAYGVDAPSFEAAALLGMTVEVVEVARPAPGALPDVGEVVGALDTLLTAASVGAAPPVLAAFRVYDGARALRGTVVVSSVHTFTLSDMLETYKRMSAADNRELVVQQIRDASRSIVALLDKLARARIVKLNLTAEGVVFVPRMQPSEDEWMICGHGFKVGETELVAGVPHLTDFDPRLTRCVGADDPGYDANSALVLMASILLHALRAEHGTLAWEVVLAAFLGRAATNSNADQPRADAQLVVAWSEAPRRPDGFPDGFHELLQRAFLGPHVLEQRNALPRELYEEALRDFLLLRTNETIDAALTPRAERFDKLVRQSTQTRWARLDPQEEHDVREEDARVMASLNAVIEGRSERRAERRRLRQHGRAWRV